MLQRAEGSLQATETGMLIREDSAPGDLAADASYTTVSLAPSFALYEGVMVLDEDRSEPGQRMRPEGFKRPGSGMGPNLDLQPGPIPIPAADSQKIAYDRVSSPPYPGSSRAGTLKRDDIVPELVERFGYACFAGIADRSTGHDETRALYGRQQCAT